MTQPSDSSDIEVGKQADAQEPQDNPPQDNPPQDNPPEDNPPEDNPPEDNPPEDNPPEDNPANSGRPMIEAIGLSKFYGVFAATREVSFKVYEGELVAFLGPNGAGKSTTMKMLTGYLSPSEGTPKIAGHDMTTDRIPGSRQLGYLPENGPLYPDMTPHGLLSFFGEARGMSPKQRVDAVDAVIEMTSLETVVHKPISKLSKGYRQRVGMAQALLHDPDVLILDEPTAGLDPNQIRGVRDTMQRLGQKKTILLSTHILQEVVAMATRVVMINEGRLVYDGSIDALNNQYGNLESAFQSLTGHSAAEMSAAGTMGDAEH
jgi:ABC-2 type transport system ATP-binding protein